MKPSLYNFSQDKFITKIKPGLIHESFDIIENQNLSADELMLLNYDIIELAANDYELFRPFVKAVDWKNNQIGMADCLIRVGSQYRPTNIFSDAIIDLVKKNNTVNKINSQQPVIVIGEFHFVFSVATKLALSGFIQIIISLTDSNAAFVELLEKKLKSFVFNLKVSFVNVNELTTSDIVGALLISDFKKSINKDAYELLTYFNFLTQGALFIDCNSINDSFLVEDARKAEIAVIDEGEVITQKYNKLREIVKI